MSDGAMDIVWFDKVEVTSFQTVYICIYIAALFLQSGVVCVFCWSFLILRLSLSAQICGDALFFVCCHVKIAVRVMIYFVISNYVFSPKCMYIFQDSFR